MIAYVIIASVVAVIHLLSFILPLLLLLLSIVSAFDMYSLLFSLHVYCPFLIFVHDFILQRSEFNTITIASIACK